MAEQKTIVNYRIPRYIINEMDKIFKLDITEKERRVIRNDIMDEIIDVTNKNDNFKPYNDRFNITDSPKRRRAVEDIVYRLTDRSYSYQKRETVSKSANCSLDTANAALRILKESGLFFWMYIKKGNSCSSIVFFYKKHPLFEQVKSYILSKDTFLAGAFSEAALQEKIQSWVPKPIVEPIVEPIVQIPSNTDEHWAEEPKKVSTVSLPFFNLKQVINNISAQRDIFQITNQLSTEFRNLTNNETTNSKVHKIMQYLTYKILDRLDRGFDIDYISSFCETFITRQFELILSHKKQEQSRKQRKQVHFEQIEKPVQFHNWLEDDVSKNTVVKVVPGHMIFNAKKLKETDLDTYISWEKTVIDCAAKLLISIDSKSLEDVLETIKIKSQQMFSNVKNKLFKSIQSKSTTDCPY